MKYTMHEKWRTLNFETRSTEYFPLERNGEQDEIIALEHFQCSSSAYVNEFRKIENHHFWNNKTSLGSQP